MKPSLSYVKVVNYEGLLNDTCHLVQGGGCVTRAKDVGDLFASLAQDGVDLPTEGRAPRRYRAVESAAASLTDHARQTLDSLIATSGQRVDVPIRNSFVRGTAERKPPLAALASRGGRGGAAVALKLYLALVWRSSKAPFTAQIPARTWASLLDLPDPAVRGARRVKDAYKNLEELQLIRTEADRGLPTTVELRLEDGSGGEYSIPSDAYRRAGAKKAQTPHLYFKVPQALWTSGHLQAMSSAALVMALILLEETHTPGAEQWWSVSVFKDRFHVSKDVRASGTRELVSRGLLTVKQENLPPTPGVTDTFGGERVRYKYRLAGDAQPVARGTSD